MTQAPVDDAYSHKSVVCYCTPTLTNSHLCVIKVHYTSEVKNSDVKLPILFPFITSTQTGIADRHPVKYVFHSLVDVQWLCPLALEAMLESDKKIKAV